MTPLLGNSPAAKRTESPTAPLFWRTAEPSKLAGDEGELRETTKKLGRRGRKVDYGWEQISTAFEIETEELK